MIPLSKISASRFYAEWKGHPLSDVKTLHKNVVSLRQDKPIIFLAGDSSLDNKYWVPTVGRNSPNVPEIYNAVFDMRSPSFKPDVAFWMNQLETRATTLNLAVEESMLRDRDSQLLPHDQFIRDNIRSQDILVISVGANDIALKPTLSTIVNMLLLAWLTPNSSLEQGTAWAYPHFVHLFKNKIESYIDRMVEVHKPRAVIVCMIYFPLEAGQSSWADMPLKALGYDKHPNRLQTAIRQMFELATKKILIPGADIVPCPLYEVLDGKDINDYTARVEPSEDGGRKMALQLKEIIDRVLGD